MRQLAHDACKNIAPELCGIESVAIVILTWNQCEVTLRCIASLVDAGYDCNRVVVWDNGSSDGTTQAVSDAFAGILVHRHPENLGVASGRNAAANLAQQELDPDFIFFLDNDMTVTKGFLELLLAPFSTDTELAQAEPKIRFQEDPTRINSAGGSRINFRAGQIEPVGYGEIDSGQYDLPTRCIPNGGATLVRTAVFRQLGGFDSVFDPYGPEDLDFSLRIKNAGYYGLYVPDAVVYHAHGRTVDGGSFSESYTYNKARHWLILMRRHASWFQRLGFYCWGAPLGVFRVLVREGCRGNAGALKGLWKSVSGMFSGHS